MIGKHGVAFYLYKQVCAKKGGEGGGRTERSMYTNFHGELGGGGVFRAQRSGARLRVSVRSLFRGGHPIKKLVLIGNYG